MMDFVLQGRKLERFKACDKCGAKGELMTCGRCKMIRYCSSTCQKAAWQQHKLECKDMAQQREIGEAQAKSRDKNNSSSLDNVSIKSSCANTACMQ